MAIDNPETQLSWLLDEIDEAAAGTSDLQNGQADGYARVAWHFGLARQDDISSYLVARRNGQGDEADELRARLLATVRAPTS